MERAQEKASRLGLTNVRFQQGDVGALPFDDSSFDTVLSLNGFHALAYLALFVLMDISLL